jgi:four helix bundle protein
MVYDLKERTLQMARSVRIFVKSLPKNLTTIDDCKQIIRSSGSVGANYIEADEAISDADFIHRIKICRKEAKETLYWLSLLLHESNPDQTNECRRLSLEAEELVKIFTSILRRREANTKSQ